MDQSNKRPPGARPRPLVHRRGPTVLKNTHCIYCGCDLSTVARNREHFCCPHSTMTYVDPGTKRALVASLAACLRGGESTAYTAANGQALRISLHVLQVG